MKGVSVGGYQPSPEEREKNRLKSSLAAAAPALIPLVMIVSTNSVTMLQVASLDRIGLLAAVVVIIALSYLLFRRRWWAGLPAMTAYIILFGLFAVKTIRPFVRLLFGQFL
jgi:CHASE2 domain-containing sensor protein